MIKYKTGFCKDCEDLKEKPLIAGRCRYHYYKYREIVNLEKNKAKITEKERKETEELDAWFKERVNEMGYVCENCGAKTLKGDSRYEKGNVAHIFPKASFKSVRTHKDNWVCLCWACHSTMDSHWSAPKMKVWPKMVEKFWKFEPFLTADERTRKFYHRFYEAAKALEESKALKKVL